MEYQLVAPGEEPSDTQWYEYDPQTGITVNEFGTITLYAHTFKEVDAETPDGLYYVETITSENVSATYTRTYSATACFPERGLAAKSPFQKAASDSHIPAVHPQLNGDGEVPLLRWRCAATSPPKT